MVWLKKGETTLCNVEIYKDSAQPAPNFKWNNEQYFCVLTSLVAAEISFPLLALIFVICIETVVDAVVPVPVVSPPLLGVQHNRLYVHCKASASSPPKLDKQISINGTPTNAYKIVAIFPLEVFGVKFPWPVDNTRQTLLRLEIGKE